MRLIAIAALAVEDDTDLGGVWSAGKSKRLPTRGAGAIDEPPCLGGNRAARVTKRRGSLGLNHGLHVRIGAMEAGGVAEQVCKHAFVIRV